MDNAAHGAINWTASLFTGLTAGLASFMAGIPRVLGALLILLIGWLIAKAIGALCAKFFKTVHVDTLAERININDFLQKAGTRLKASDLLGLTLKWVVFLIFINMAADQLGLGQVSAIVNSMLLYVPKILVAMLILGLGAFLGQIVAGVVRGAAGEAGMRNASFLGKLASGAVMAFAIIGAVNELGVAPIVVNTLYIGLVASLSLALGLAFGLGGRDTAARLTEQWLGQAQQTAANAPKPVSGGDALSAPVSPRPSASYPARP